MTFWDISAVGKTMELLLFSLPVLQLSDLSLICSLLSAIGFCVTLGSLLIWVSDRSWSCCFCLLYQEGKTASTPCVFIDLTGSSNMDWGEKQLLKLGIKVFGWILTQKWYPVLLSKRLTKELKRIMLSDIYVIFERWVGTWTFTWGFTSPADVNMKGENTEMSLK